MGVDQEQGIAAGAVVRRDGEAVGPARLPFRIVTQCHLGQAATVEILQVLQVHPLDVTTDTALTEAQGHPGFKPRQQAGLHLGMGMEVIIQPVGKGIHQGL